ncbi:MAG: VWA domain-containing protein [Polyangiaceae bacterium]
MREGDTIAIVLAGAPPRVALATTSERDVALGVLEGERPSDRATDLAGALALAEGLLRSAPQIDKRVVLFSDRADGHPDAEPLDLADPDMSLWEPLSDLGATGEADCGIASATRVDQRVSVHVVCTAGGSAAGRALSIRAPTGVLATASIEAPGSTDVTLEIPKDASDRLVAELGPPGDAIAEDDRAAVSTAVPNAGIVVVADPAKNRLITGGAPPVEQAFAALDLASAARPLPQPPEHAEDLKESSGLILDDPPGLTPEQRSVVIEWVEGGGVLLLSLGRGAGAAPLGAGFDGLIPGVVRYGPPGADDVDPKKCPFFGAATPSLLHLETRGRAQLEHSATEGASIECAFADGAPLLVRRELGRGVILATTLPFNVDESDLALRPAFLTLLDRFAEEARSHGGTRRVDVGRDFTFGGATGVSGSHTPLDGSPRFELEAKTSNGIVHVTAPLVGAYDFRCGDHRETRVANLPEAEVDLRPRAVAARAHDAALGGKAPRVDVSPQVALVLLGLLAAETLTRIVLRARRRARARSAEAAAEGGDSPKADADPPEDDAAIRA